MNKNTKIVLIGNYQKDKQESMIRFANLLSEGFTDAGYDTEIWWPKPFFGRLFTVTTTGYRKWVGYVDKWIIFPFILRNRVRKKRKPSENVRYHVCDHSNSPYLPHLPPEDTIITCHDVLAIRGSMGFADAYAPASSTGKYYQQWILKNLIKADKIGCNSQNTRNQLVVLANEKGASEKDWRVVHLSYNGEYFPMTPEDCNPLLIASGISIDKPFCLHVGNEHIRKNRIFLLDVLYTIKDSWDGFFVFAGKVDDSKLISRAQELGVYSRIVLLSKPSNLVLRALYSSCQAFLYPSFSEGFPWPTIEAQSCGAPVVTSHIAPMPEIAGTGALYASPTDATDFGTEVLRLENHSFRKTMIDQGFANCKRFAPPKMIDDYLAFHQLKRLLPEVN